MKSLAVILLGCLPLAVLTLGAFLERGEMERAAEALPVIDAAAVTATVDAASKLAAADKPAAEQLAAVDVLSAGAMPKFAETPQESPLRPAADAYVQWTTAHRLWDDYLAVERQASGEPGRLQEALKRFEEFKRKQKESPVEGNQEVLALVDGRIKSLGGQVDRNSRQADAQTLIQRARDAFRVQHYGECASTCEELLAKHAAVVDAKSLENVRLLGQRARFWDDNMQLATALKTETTPAGRKAQVDRFLARYSNRKGRTSDELKAIDGWDKVRRDAEQEIHNEKLHRQATGALQQFKDQLPGQLEERLSRAAALVDSYPSEEVRRSLRQQAPQWLGEYLPEKPLQEPKLIQEAANQQGEILRGFFKEVTAADGKVVGYKRFPTYEQYLDPVAQVGTYRPEELSQKPGTSTPRRLANQYREGLAKLMKNLGRRDEWTRFAELCESLEGQSREYRRRPGASQESLSFAKEAVFAKEMASGDGVKELDKIMGK